MKNATLQRLCCSLDIQNPNAINFRKSFSAGYTISLRPVNLHDEHDIIQIGRWVEQGYGHAQPHDQLRVMYTLIAESVYAQSFIVMLNDDLPISQLDIFDISHDELKGYYPAQPGDYHVYIPVIPVADTFASLPVHVLQACMEHFFSYAEVSRIVWPLYKQDKRSNNLTGQAGFRLLQTIFEPTATGLRPKNLYYMKRGTI